MKDTLQKVVELTEYYPVSELLNYFKPYETDEEYREAVDRLYKIVEEKR